ncbi:response regulator [uncultured Tateyamaria sp.]|uniref:response regulator n=1 Tax=uncultured Tateyamaria sp. TaxID=455651 RepID=UPI0026082B5C|nr:response regulator [uncultured Tateyamaria sp.]
MSGRKIVLVDDDEAYLAALAGELRGDASVHTFGRVVDCLEFLKQKGENVDIICVDLFMPDVQGVDWQLSGLSTIKQIREIYREDAPVIGVLSGMDAVVHIHTCLKNGADWFIEKRFDVKSVADQLLEKPLQPTAVNA